MTKEYEILNLDCGGCAAKIEAKANTMNGVSDATINLYKKRMIIETSNNFNEEKFINNINKYADSIEPGTKILSLNPNMNKKIEEDKEKKEKLSEKIEKYTLILGIILFIGALIVGQYCFYGKLTLCVLAYIVLGYDVIINSIKNMRRGNFLDENFLMAIATFGAFYIGEYTEAVGVMLFYKIGEYYQDKAVSNSRRSIKKLLDLKPEFANIKDKNGNLIQIAPRDLKVGDTITVKSGEKVPVDGKIISGHTTLNTSALTGESLPVEASIGDDILSGSLNGAGTIEVQVSKLFSDSTVNKIIEMVENAGDKKSVSEKFITKFARFYTPIVVILALIVAFIVPLILGNFHMWFGRALIFLVISCPCALVISVPLTFFSSIGEASKQGILIKGGNYLEALDYVGAMVFDKTGTLTKGKFVVDKLNPNGVSDKELLHITQIGEIFSVHPIGKAILQDRDEAIDESLITSYNEIAGYGIMATYDTHNIIVGNYLLMKKHNIPATEINYAGTVVYTAMDGKFLGTVCVSDEIKSDSKETIDFLLKEHIVPYMLTGDNSLIGYNVGERIDIPKQNIFTNLLPQQKVEKLQEIQKDTKNNVVFIGDGVNDAPVLALADIGIAMGGHGSDIAVESADVVIMHDEPSKIINLLHIAKVNKKVVLQNIIFAILVKVLVMILGVFGFADMWLAILSDVGVSLLAVLNASIGVKTRLSE